MPTRYSILNDRPLDVARVLQRTRKDPLPRRLDALHLAEINPNDPLGRPFVRAFFGAMDALAHAFLVAGPGPTRTHLRDTYVGGSLMHLLAGARNESPEYIGKRLAGLALGTGMIVGAFLWSLGTTPI